MKILDTQEGRGWRLVLVETEHMHVYVTETLLVVGVKEPTWAATNTSAFLRPEKQAAYLKAVGSAVVEMNDAVRRAAEGGNECPVCLGGKTALDDPGKKCGACDGSGRKA